LIEELQYLQPANIKELSTALGQSTNTTRSQLNKLHRLELVIKTSFEQHSLYCLNGNFNLFIGQVLQFLNYSG
jgi:Mn-dependent DtxR family transcriptional regulator